MDAWRRKFTRNILAITFALQVPFAVLVALAFGHAGLASFAAPLAILAVLIIHTPMYFRLADWTDHRRSGFARVWFFETPFFVHFTASLVFGPLGWLALLVLAAMRLAHVPVHVFAVLAALYATCFAMGAYAVLVRRFWVRTRRVDVVVPRLDPALDGVTFAQLSDLHCGPYMPRAYLGYLAGRVAREHPDAVLLTGDMVTHGVGYVDDITALVRSLAKEAPLGVFASMGNHDYFGAVNEIDEAMAAGGARVLRNRGVSVAGPRGGSLHIAAIDDSWTRRDDVDLALAARSERDGASVLIAHDPETFPRIAKRGDVDLVVSGHTHGGQFAVPFFARRWNLARLRYRYTLGLYRDATTALYVHAGNGTSGPPARFGVAPEIAVLKLRRG